MASGDSILNQYQLVIILEKKFILWYKKIKLLFHIWHIFDKFKVALGFFLLHLFRDMRLEIFIREPGRGKSGRVSWPLVRNISQEFRTHGVQLWMSLNFIVDQYYGDK